MLTTTPPPSTIQLPPPPPSAGWSALPTAHQRQRRWPRFLYDPVFVRRLVALNASWEDDRS